MGSRVSGLDALVVPTADDLTVGDEDRANRQPALSQSLSSFLQGCVP